jgi:hypothetical protein
VLDEDGDDVLENVNLVDGEKVGAALGCVYHECSLYDAL